MPAPTVPNSICILRLSALGDVTHMLPVIDTLKRQWPQTKITWVIGNAEHKLVGNLTDIDFIIFDKSLGWRAYSNLRTQLANRQFDVLLHMQVSLRANLASLFIKAATRVGYDRLRSKDLHGLFINSRIEAHDGQHVVEAFLSFLSKIGISEDRHQYNWNIPIPESAYEFAARHRSDGKKTLIISPCSSHKLRNWTAARYAKVADYAIQKHGMQVILCGGPSKIERQMGDAIAASMQQTPLDLIGKDTFLQFLALLESASILISPDSGPAHMATCVGTPVIGLYAASNPHRSGPYLSSDWCVDKYAAAAQQFLKVDANTLRWGTKIEYPGVMELITPEDVFEKLDELVRSL